ncbi:hypothetical protein FHR92_005326 [Fontibacillus solani]|uniref:Uncharacterized protein n=1 Tax=Fontibacillus solani TaxID=1572857 RepID=A0A7W3SZ19_9BACL|nr:hypothetical protein [Fontibacillus solani]MBA9088792.1 hypothetical protein [Fontibacillus solani]
MSNLVPIQITLQAATAIDAKQLVQDLAGTMSGMPSTAIPAQTEVSTLVGSAPPVQPPQQFTQPAYQQPQGYSAPSVPIAQSQPPQPPLGTVPTAPAPSYDVTQLGVAAQPLVDAGQSAQLVGWLQQHGSSALTDLNPSLYGEFATFLRSLGAKI